MLREVHGQEVLASTWIIMCLFLPCHFVFLCSALPHFFDCRYKEGDLNVGENSCVDRCASKYWQVTGIVGQLLGGGQQ